MKNHARLAMAAALCAALLSGAAANAQRGDSDTQARTLAESIRRSLPPAKWTALQKSAADLNLELVKVAGSAALMRKVGRATSPAQLPAVLRGALEKNAAAYVAATGERDPEKIVTALTALSLFEAEESAQETMECLNAKSAIREEIAMLRDALFAGSFPVTLTIRIFTITDGGVETVETSKAFTKAELENEIGKLEAQLQQLDDMTQMDQMDLQDAMQKQQKVIQAISNIMKSIHDTLKAIIQNLRA